MSKASRSFIADILDAAPAAPASDPSRRERMVAAAAKMREARRAKRAARAAAGTAAGTGTKIGVEDAPLPPGLTEAQVARAARGIAERSGLHDDLAAVAVVRALVDRAARGAAIPGAAGAADRTFLARLLNLPGHRPGLADLATSPVRGVSSARRGRGSGPVIDAEDGDAAPPSNATVAQRKRDLKAQLLDRLHVALAQPAPDRPDE